MNKNSRGITPILIVVILGIIGIVSYLVVTQSIIQTPSTSTAEPAQELPADWKTYTNEKDKYMLKYPPSWDSNIKSPDYYREGPGSSLRGAFLSVFVVDAEKSTIGEELRYRTYGYYLPSPEASGPNPYEEISNPENSKLGGENALRYYGKDYYAGNFISTLTIQKGKTYILTLNYEQGRKEEFEIIYNLILSTFKFTQ